MDATLTERDLELLVDLYRYRYLSTPQIQRIHFPSHQTTTRRLRTLRAGRIAKPFRVPGIGEYLWMLDARGVELVAETLGTAAPHLELLKQDRDRPPHDYYFARHFLACNDFRITLTEACAQHPEVRLLGYLPEYFAERQGSGRVVRHLRDVVADPTMLREKVSHTPDAVFALARGENQVLHFLELDRGTEVLTNPHRGVLKHLRFYLHYFVSGGYKRYEADFPGAAFRGFRLLFVTTSSERVSNIRAVGATFPFEPERTKRFFWLTTRDAIAPSTFWAPIWRSWDGADDHGYALA